MPELPEIDEEDSAIYNFDKMQNIIWALDFLRKEAASTGLDDVKTMIDSTFKIILTTYTLVLRYSCLGSALPEELQ